MRAIQLTVLFAVIIQTVPAFSQYQLTSTRASENRNYNSSLNKFEIENIRKGLLSAWKHGVNPGAYWSKDLEVTYQRGGNLERTLRPQANQAFLKLLKDLAVGSVDPQSTTRDIKLVKKNFFTPQQLQVLALAAADVDRLIENVSPQNEPYLAVKQGVQKLYPTCFNDKWKEIVPLNVTLRLYSRDPVVLEIKNRLSLLGYKFKNKDDLFDGDLRDAVNDIEWGLRINPDGAISPKGKVWAFLNVPCLDRLRQLQIDMEKMRWFPQYFEKRYIFVNLAMSYFILIDQSNPDWERVMSFRTVNGRPARKSPTMRDEIVSVIINPFWVVPPTIFWEDKVNDLKNLSKSEIADYFNTRHYEAWSGDFRRRIDPTTIDWAGIGNGRSSRDIIIRQLPHLGNALGVLKFDLTNSFAIYLHDTNQRELFNEPARQLSSGCIRLEKPLDLAQYLLEDTPWDRATISSMMARPGEVVAKPTVISVPKNKITSVYTVYQTSLMSSDGVIRFVDDNYGQNAVIQARMRGIF